MHILKLVLHLTFYCKLHNTLDCPPLLYSALGDALSAPSSRTSLDGRQPVATPPESPNWVVGAAKKMSTDGAGLDAISEESTESRQRSHTAPSMSMLHS